MAEASIAKPVRPLSKIEKAAVLFLCMDEKSTGELFQQMKDDEIRKIGSALLRLGKVPESQISSVIEEFTNGVVKQKSSLAADGPKSNEIEIDGAKAAEKMFTKALPRGRGKSILQSIWDTPAVSAEKQDFAELINEYSADTLYDLIKEEHPQVIAVLLYYAKKGIAKAVLDKFSDETKIDLIERVARLQRISGQFLDEIGGFVARKMADKQQKERSGEVVEEVQEEEAKGSMEVEGTSGALKLLKSLPWEDAMDMIKKLSEHDPELAQILEKQMLTVEDLERADDAGIRELLRNVSNDDLKVALKNTQDSVKNKFFNNMSERAGLILREDMDVLPPLKVEDIEAAQDKIVAAVKQLMQEDKLHFSVLADDE